LAIAPTASIGLVAGTTPGLDPQFSQIFSRSTSSGKFLEVNRNLVEDLRAAGLWEKVREDLLRAQGDLSRVEGIPAELQEIYRTSFQLSPYAFLNVAARAQKWIDQAISRNVYLHNPRTSPLSVTLGRRHAEFSLPNVTLSGKVDARALMPVLLPNGRAILSIRWWEPATTLGKPC